MTGRQRIERLVRACPVSCLDVTPVCGLLPVPVPPNIARPPPPPPPRPVQSPPPPNPPPPSAAPSPFPSPSPSPSTSSCRDDPSYRDLYSCRDWQGYACRSGGYGVTGQRRIEQLVRACPVSCADVTPVCGRSWPPPPPPTTLPPPAMLPSWCPLYCNVRARPTYCDRAGCPVVSAPLTSPPPPRPPPPPDPMPPQPVASRPSARCTDDPSYADVGTGWTCSAWRGWNPGCRRGYPPITSPERIARLVHSCPQSCADGTPVCS